MSTDNYEKLESFKTLEKDWDGYDADPISETTINNAKLLLDKLKENNQDGWEVFPINNGNVQIEKDINNNTYLEIEISNSNYTYMFFRNGLEVVGSVYHIEENDSLIQELVKINSKKNEIELQEKNNGLATSSRFAE